MGLSPLNISQEDNATDAGDVCAFVVKVQQSDEIVFAGDHFNLPYTFPSIDLFVKFSLNEFFALFIKDRNEFILNFNF